MNKGTLTIISNTQALLGCPSGDVIYSASQRGQFQADILLWLDVGGVLALPFPVELIDLRSQSQELHGSKLEHLSPEDFWAYQAKMIGLGTSGKKE